MQRLRDFLIVVVLGAVVIYGLIYAFRSMNDYNLSVNVVYGQALRACEEDERICSFSSVESAQRYLDSPEHKNSVAIRELKKQQDAAASEAASAAIESAKKHSRADRHRKID